MGQKPQQMFYLGKNLPRATLAQEKGPVLYLQVGISMMQKGGTLVQGCWDYLVSELWVTKQCQVIDKHLLWSAIMEGNRVERIRI